MKILVATPAPAGMPLGNRVTALRWQRILRGLGHRVRVATSWRGEPCDLLVALHAEKSARSIAAFRAANPGACVVVALTGTDVYAPRGLSRRSRRSLERADRIVVLQREALSELDPSLRARTRVVLQSATRARAHAAPRTDRFEVVAVGHLRAVKDPLLAARATRLLPRGSRIAVDHYGSALDARLGAEARRESDANPRWSWRGPRSHAAIARILARARAFVLTSRSEGGAAALSEAIVTGLPVLATKIPATVGMLGPRHPGFFAIGDADALARLLRRCELDDGFRRRLQRASERRAARFAPRLERAAWRSLLRELANERRRTRRGPRSTSRA